MNKPREWWINVQKIPLTDSNSVVSGFNSQEMAAKHRSGDQETIRVVWLTDEDLATNGIALVALKSIIESIKAYHLALDRREHGGLAARLCLNKIENALGMGWVQGKALDEYLAAQSRAPEQLAAQPQKITRDWLCGLVGPPQAPSNSYWDIPIVTEHSKGETFLRVHSPIDGAWMTDLFSATDKQGIGIVNWPTTQQQLLSLMCALGCLVDYIDDGSLPKQPSSNQGTNSL